MAQLLLRAIGVIGLDIRMRPMQKNQTLEMAIELHDTRADKTKYHVQLLHY